MSIIEIILSIPFTFKIGDPTPFAWATVVMYLLAALLCFVCAWKAERIFRDGHVWLHRFIWGSLGFGLLFLGVNKQLDLQSWFTKVVKAIVRQQGWYEAGQGGQGLFILGLLVISGLAFLVGLFFLRHVWRQYWLLMFGVLFIVRFVITRAAEFYGVDLPKLSQFTGGYRILWAMEFLGAFFIALAAIYNLRRLRYGGNEESSVVQERV